jgi:hypothetical protein
MLAKLVGTDCTARWWGARRRTLDDSPLARCLVICNNVEGWPPAASWKIMIEKEREKKRE